jgi:hypothetical protein
MSGEPEKRQAEAGEHRSHIELLRAMGATEYDPIAPDQYLFRLDPAMKLSTVANQLHAWLLWMTIHSKPGGRTDFAAWGGRPLGLKEASQDLGHDLAAISKAWHELEAKGIARRDEKKRLYPCGKIDFKRLTHGEKRKTTGGETKEKLFVQTTYPNYIYKHLQQLNETDQKKFEDRCQRLEAAEDEAIAEATARIREAFASPRKALLAMIGLKPIELEKRRDKNPKREPQLEISLQLEFPEFDFVQTTGGGRNGHFVQSEKVGLYNPENGFVQSGHPYLAEESEESEKVSEWPRPQAEEPNPNRPPPATPLTQNPFPEVEPVDRLQDPDPVIDYVQHRFGHKLDREMRAKYSALAKQFQIPAYSVSQFVAWICDKKESARYSIDNPGALFGWVRQDLPNWIRQHGDEIERVRRWEAAQASPPAPQNDEPFDPAEFNAKMRELKAFRAKGGGEE